MSMSILTTFCCTTCLWKSLNPKISTNLRLQSVALWLQMLDLKEKVKTKLEEQLNEEKDSCSTNREEMVKKQYSKVENAYDVSWKSKCDSNNSKIYTNHLYNSLSYYPM